TLSRPRPPRPPGASERARPPALTLRRCPEPKIIGEIITEPKRENNKNTDALFAYLKSRCCISVDAGLNYTSADIKVCKRERSAMTISPQKPWKVSELNLVKGASKNRQQEDRLRADAWRKMREAELEAVVNRSYDGMEYPEIRGLVAKASEVMAP